MYLTYYEITEDITITDIEINKKDLIALYNLILESKYTFCDVERLTLLKKALEFSEEILFLNRKDFFTLFYDCDKSKKFNVYYPYTDDIEFISKLVYENHRNVNYSYTFENITEFDKDKRFLLSENSLAYIEFCAIQFSSCIVDEIFDILSIIDKIILGDEHTIVNNVRFYYVTAEILKKLYSEEEINSKKFITNIYCEDWILSSDNYRK